MQLNLVRTTRQSGFTLIELIVVIVILGVLAATALPKFINMKTEARIAKLQATAGTLAAASDLAYAKCVLIAGCYTNGKGVAIPLSDGRSASMHHGYPTAYRRPDYSGILDWANVSGFTILETGGVFQIDDAPDPSNCRVQFIEAASYGARPVVLTTASGC